MCKMKRSNNFKYNDNRNRFQKPFIDITKYFNRKYSFELQNAWQVPSTAFSTKKWSISSLQEKKKKLNQVKEQLNPFPLQEWSKHTKHREPSSFVMRNLKQQADPELLTQVGCH